LGTDSLDFVQRGKVSIVRRQYAEAVKICRLGLLGQPSLLEGRLVLGMALTALGRWDEVLAEMRVALETDPNAALAWLLKGEALVGKGDYLQAEQTLKRAKELDPSNNKADQLLAEIATAVAAGFEGLPAEPTDTKVYPARQTGNTDPDLGNVVQPMPMDRGHLVQVPEDSDDVRVEYEDDATEVDPDPSDQVNIGVGSKRKKKQADRPASVLVDFGESEDTVEDSQVGTETFHKPGVRRVDDSSYEGPATDDYSERARPRAPVHAGPRAAAKATAGGFDTDEPSEDSTMTPAEILRARKPTVRRAIDDLPLDGMEPPNEPSEPSIVLDTRDLMIEPSREGFPRGFAPTFDSEDGEDEQTRQRRQRQVDEHAGTAPETPEPVLHRQRPSRQLDPLPRGSQQQPSFPKNSSEAPTEMRGENGVYGDGDGHEGPYGGGEEDLPGVVRVPVKRKKPRTTLFVRTDSVPWLGDRSRRGIALLLTALVAVVAVGVATGLLVREWRMRARVAKRHELATMKLASGNYPGFQAAELLYRQILAERDDPEARAQRARVLAEMSFEFGDSTEAAQRAMASLGDDAAGPCADKRPGCQEAAEARVYLAMAKGELDRASRLAQALRRKFPDATASYLVGRAELLLERPDTAADALRTAAEGDAHNPLVLHGLGLAEAAARRDDRALEAYRHALQDNANHIATIIDRALLQVDRGSDREAARGALEGVVGKLVGDSSPGQLARAFLGLAELELQKGDVTAARRDLAQAAAKRRDGDALLSEELAQAFADAYMLDEAEREAKRAISAAGRLTPRLVLAEVALRRAQPQKALAVIEEAGTSRPEALVMRALASLMLGRKESARLDAEAALRVQPQGEVASAAHVALAKVDIADGHPDKAQHTLAALERMSQKSADVAAAMAAVFLAEKVPDRARYWLQQALVRDPLDVDARLQLAKLDHETGQFAAAREDLKTLLATSATYAPARRELALVELDDGDAVAARDELDSLISADDNVDLEVLTNAARAHLLLGDGPGAEERLDRAQKLPSAPQAAEELLDLRAHALIVEHKPADAAAMLRKAVPTAMRGETLALLMDAYLDLEQPDRATEVVRMAPPRARIGVDLLVARSRLAIERGRDSVAEGFAAEAIARMRGPRSPRSLKAEAYAILGRSQYEQGSFKLALRSLKTATTLDSRLARAWHYLGLVDYDLKRMPDARTALEAAVKADPLFADAWYYLGRSRQALADPTAKDAFLKYLEIASKGPYAAEVRDALRGDGTTTPAPKMSTPTSSRPRIRRRGR
jgi:tetratricopeptide (TPR) repeat protein